MDSRFITAALTAITTERNTTSSSSMDSATTTPISHGSRCPMRLAKLTLPALGPVTYALIPVPAIAFGSTVSLIRFTRVSVAGSCSPGGGVGDQHRRLAVPAHDHRNHRRDPRGSGDRGGQPPSAG